MPLKKLIDRLKRKDWRTYSRNITFGHELSRFSKEFRTNLITLIVSALGLVAALTWQDAIKQAINDLFPQQSLFVYKFYVAIVVSILAVIVTYFLSRIRGED